MLVLIKCIHKVENGPELTWEQGTIIKEANILKCLMPVHLHHCPWFHPNTFLLEIQKTKLRRCLLEHRNIWGEELKSKREHSLMEVETV